MEKQDSRREQESSIVTSFESRLLGYSFSTLTRRNSSMTWLAKFFSNSFVKTKIIRKDETWIIYLRFLCPCGKESSKFLY